MDILDIYKAIWQESLKLEKWFQTIPAVDAKQNSFIFFDALRLKIADTIVKEYGLADYDPVMDTLYEFECGDITKTELLKLFKQFKKEGMQAI